MRSHLLLRPRYSFTVFQLPKKSESVDEHLSAVFEEPDFGSGLIPPPHRHLDNSVAGSFGETKDLDIEGKSLTV
jgi:hypothetical protein